MAKKGSEYVVSQDDRRRARMPELGKFQNKCFRALASPSCGLYLLAWMPLLFCHFESEVAIISVVTVFKVIMYSFSVERFSVRVATMHSGDIHY